MYKCKLLALILTIFCLLSAAGCTNKTDKAYIYFELPEIPSTLDPQTARADAELLIIKNIYEGLMRKDAKGEVVTGAAQSYDKNGLTYTFNLRDDILWSNGDRLTADDFVFGINRALNPETKAPFVSRLSSISSVTAPDDDTVKITLSFEDENFLENLTTSVAMPCNEEFFTESAGKYGLFSENIICNGSYRLTKWNKESFGIRLYRNEEYKGDHKAKNAAVFLTCNDDEPVTQKLSENNIDIAFIDCALKEDMESQGFKTSSIQNICWFLTINDDFSKNMRTALFNLVGNEVYSKSLKPGYTNANTIFPEICNITTDGTATVPYNLENGKSLYTGEVKKLENSKFPSNVILYYYDNGFVKPMVTDIVGHWQKNLSAFVNIEAVDSAETLVPQLKSQTLSMAIFPVRSDSKNTAEYLGYFNINSISEDYNGIEHQILKSRNITPLFFEETTLCYSPSIKEIYTTEDNGFIDFAFVVKEEG